MGTSIAPVLLAMALGAAACQKADANGSGKRRGPMAYPVEVEVLKPERVEYAIDAVGSIDAFESVQITARVSGAIDAVRFREGDQVKKNQLLVEIEPQRYQLAVAQAKAQVERAEASRGEAERELERAQKLAQEGIGTSMDVSGWQTKLASAGAEESQARAALNLASLNLNDARVRAPIAGTIQTRNVQTGQYAASGTVLATVINPDPLLLRFKVTEREAVPMRLGMEAHFKVRDEPTQHSAKITFVAGAAEPSSRMVPITAEIQGDTSGLRPGTFAEVRVPVDASEGSVVVPETAIRSSDRGFLAYVVTGDRAKERVLTLGLRTPDGRVEVKDGLKLGESLVVRGSEALREGAEVITRAPSRDRASGPAPSGSAP